jgi:carbon storage regulator
LILILQTPSATGKLVLHFEAITKSGTTMLVLSRKVGERIKIGDGVTITVVRVSGGGVRLGIEAPPEMAVVREELYHELQKSDIPLPAEQIKPTDSTGNGVQ